ncbi:Structural protein [Lapidilactobacillus dextrinicus DSM 20335]|uniref:Structural protein n=1 Tax=Lapidilactobacillus dextrinicus DSM 20335 TaxID=1423738 RepID=A0A0R2BTA7_9LACO|nr:hypothetical protein [Lapidilactobacillus dextrinicus]KRM79467.1 Structural protein [Lapidilactobacillus dextrinicus DSM 20335]QFG46697.1 structural protein [Lapidilactobacillus dextrinicus]
MEWSYPWLSIDGDRMYDDSDFARFYSNLFTDGVSMTTANGLKVTTSSTGGMQVQVSSGAANIEGRSYFNSTSLPLNINVASSSQDRTDSVVLRMDKGLRTMTLMVKQGNTQVIRTTDIVELQLATIEIKRNASNITADLITDKRADENVCGYSTPFSKVSVSGLEDQYQALLQKIIDEMNQYTEDEKGKFETDMQMIIDKGTAQLNNQQADWQAFLNSITDQLTSNQAVNLQNQINLLKADQQTWTITNTPIPYPQIIVTGWQNGFGVTALGESNWLGDVPETIPATIGYPSKNEVYVKVPLIWKMMDPVITETEPYSYLVAEGTRALRIRLLGVK